MVKTKVKYLFKVEVIIKKIKYKKEICAILDIDGVLWIGNSPGEGAVKFLDSLHSDDIPFCLLSNTCNVSKDKRFKELRDAGFKLESEQLITAVEVTKDWLLETGVKTIMYLGTQDAFKDLQTSFVVKNTKPVDAVVIGDFFTNYERSLLNNATKAVIAGATLVAMHRNPRWFDGIEWYVDNGFWVAGLEYVTGKKAIVLGKPYQNAYQAAMNRLGKSKSCSKDVIFISDDIMFDLKGAKDFDLRTVHFGSTETSQPWVDYYAKDYDSLLSLIRNG